jgi:hypothetical protein
MKYYGHVGQSSSCIQTSISVIFLRFSGRTPPSIISPQINIKIEEKNIILLVAS